MPVSSSVRIVLSLSKGLLRKGIGRVERMDKTEREPGVLGACFPSLWKAPTLGGRVR